MSLIYQQAYALVVEQLQKREAEEIGVRVYPLTSEGKLARPCELEPEARLLPWCVSQFLDTYQGLQTAALAGVLCNYDDCVMAAALLSCVPHQLEESVVRTALEEADGSTVWNLLTQVNACRRAMSFGAEVFEKRISPASVELLAIMAAERVISDPDCFWESPDSGQALLRYWERKALPMGVIGKPFEEILWLRAERLGPGAGRIAQILDRLHRAKFGLSVAEFSRAIAELSIDLDMDRDWHPLPPCTDDLELAGLEISTHKYFPRSNFEPDQPWSRWRHFLYVAAVTLLQLHSADAASVFKIALLWSHLEKRDDPCTTWAVMEKMMNCGQTEIWSVIEQAIPFTVPWEIEHSRWWEHIFSNSLECLRWEMSPLALLMASNDALATFATDVSVSVRRIPDGDFIWGSTIQQSLMSRKAEAFGQAASERLSTLQASGNRHGEMFRYIRQNLDALEDIGKFIGPRFKSRKKGRNAAWANK